MNIKRFILASLAAYIFIFLFDWGFHGILLDSIYKDTSYFWRTKEETQLYMHWMLFAQLLLAFIFTWIFTKGYENKGIPEGFRYGFMVSLLFVPSILINYTVIPYPPNLILLWVIGTFVELSLAGGIIAGIYKSNN